MIDTLRIAYTIFVAFDVHYNIPLLHFNNLKKESLLTRKMFEHFVL